MLDEEVAQWCAEIASRSTTAIAKHSFNVDTEQIGPMGQLGLKALRLYYDMDESREGVAALREKRDPDLCRTSSSTSCGWANSGANRAPP